MIVNKERLEKIIDSVTEGCDYCPLAGKCANIKGISCNETLRTWLTEFDIQTALEEGAHIVNDRAIFPPQEVEIMNLEVGEE